MDAPAERRVECTPRNIKCLYATREAIQVLSELETRPPAHQLTAGVFIKWAYSYSDDGQQRKQLVRCKSAQRTNTGDLRFRVEVEPNQQLKLVNTRNVSQRGVEPEELEDVRARFPHGIPVHEVWPAVNRLLRVQKYLRLPAREREQAQAQLLEDLLAAGQVPWNVTDLLLDEHGNIRDLSVKLEPEELWPGEQPQAGGGSGLRSGSAGEDGDTVPSMGLGSGAAGGSVSERQPAAAAAAAATAANTAAPNGRGEPPGGGGPEVGMEMDELELGLDADWEEEWQAGQLGAGAGADQEGGDDDGDEDDEYDHEDEDVHDEDYDVQQEEGREGQAGDEDGNGPDDDDGGDGAGDDGDGGGDEQSARGKRRVRSPSPCLSDADSCDSAEAHGGEGSSGATDRSGFHKWIQGYHGICLGSTKYVTSSQYRQMVEAIEARMKAVKAVTPSGRRMVPKLTEYSRKLGAKGFFVEAGVLYKRVREGAGGGSSSAAGPSTSAADVASGAGGSGRLIVIPRRKMEVTIAAAHGPSHKDVDSTWKEVSSKFHGITRVSVEKYINEYCKECEKSKRSRGGGRVFVSQPRLPRPLETDQDRNAATSPLMQAIHASLPNLTPREFQAVQQVVKTSVVVRFEKPKRPRTTAGDGGGSGRGHGARQWAAPVGQRTNIEQQEGGGMEPDPATYGRAGARALGRPQLSGPARLQQQQQPMPAPGHPPHVLGPQLNGLQHQPPAGPRGGQLPHGAGPSSYSHGAGPSYSHGGPTAAAAGPGMGGLAQGQQPARLQQSVEFRYGDGTMDRETSSQEQWQGQKGVVRSNVQIPVDSIALHQAAQAAGIEGGAAGLPTEMQNVAQNLLRSMVFNTNMTSAEGVDQRVIQRFEVVLPQPQQQHQGGTAGPSEQQGSQANPSSGNGDGGGGGSGGGGGIDDGGIDDGGDSHGYAPTSPEPANRVWPSPFFEGTLKVADGGFASSGDVEAWVLPRAAGVDPGYHYLAATQEVDVPEVLEAMLRPDWLSNVPFNLKTGKAMVAKEFECLARHWTGNLLLLRLDQEPGEVMGKILDKARQWKAGNCQKLRPFFSNRINIEGIRLRAPSAAKPTFVLMLLPLEELDAARRMNLPEPLDGAGRGRWLAGMLMVENRPALANPTTAASNEKLEAKRKMVELPKAAMRHFLEGRFGEARLLTPPGAAAGAGGEQGGQAGAAAGPSAAQAPSNGRPHPQQHQHARGAANGQQQQQRAPQAVHNPYEDDDSGSDGGDDSDMDEGNGHGSGLGRSASPTPPVVPRSPSFTHGGTRPSHISRQRTGSSSQHRNGGGSAASVGGSASVSEASGVRQPPRRWTGLLEIAPGLVGREAISLPITLYASALAGDTVAPSGQWLHVMGSTVGPEQLLPLSSPLHVAEAPVRGDAWFATGGGGAAWSGLPLVVELAGTSHDALKVSERALDNPQLSYTGGRGQKQCRAYIAKLPPPVAGGRALELTMWPGALVPRSLLLHVPPALQQRCEAAANNAAQQRRVYDKFMVGIVSLLPPRLLPPVGVAPPGGRVHGFNQHAQQQRRYAAPHLRPDARMGQWPGLPPPAAAAGGNYTRDNGYSGVRGQGRQGWQ